MGMHGNCRCRNIEVSWQIRDYSLVPRACQCTYCLQHAAAWVSKSGSNFAVTIHNTERYSTVEQGSHTALFHQCANCDQVVFVTTCIDGELYGALNANCMHNKSGFPKPLATDFSAQSAVEKLTRWQQHWCRPVIIETRV